MQNFRRILTNFRHLNSHQRYTLLKIVSGILLGSLILSLFIFLIIQAKPNVHQYPTISSQNEPEPGDVKIQEPRNLKKPEPLEKDTLQKNDEQGKKDQKPDERSINPPKIPKPLNLPNPTLQNNEGKGEVKESDDTKSLNKDHFIDPKNLPKYQTGNKETEKQNEKPPEKTNKKIEKPKEERKPNLPQKPSMPSQLQNKGEKVKEDNKKTTLPESAPLRAEDIQKAIMSGLKYVYSISKKNEDAFVDDSNEILSTFVPFLYIKSSNKDHEEELYNKASLYSAKLVDKFRGSMKQVMRHKIQEEQDSNEKNDPEHMKSLLRLTKSLLNYQILSIPHKNIRKNLRKLLAPLRKQKENEIFSRIWKLDIASPSVTQQYIKEIPKLIERLNNTQNKNDGTMKIFRQKLQSLGELYERLSEALSDLHALNRTGFVVSRIGLSDVLTKWLVAIRPLYKITPLYVNMKQSKHKIRLIGTLKDTYHVLVHLVVKIVNVVTDYSFWKIDKKLLQEEYDFLRASIQPTIAIFNDPEQVGEILDCLLSMGADTRSDPILIRGQQYLLENQQTNGGWKSPYDEEGFNFPGTRSSILGLLDHSYAPAGPTSLSKLKTFDEWKNALRQKDLMKLDFTVSITKKQK